MRVIRAMILHESKNDVIPAPSIAKFHDSQAQLQQRQTRCSMFLSTDSSRAVLLT